MEPLSPALNLQGFDFGAYLRGSPNLMSALRASLPAAGLLTPGALALNLADILDAEDPGGAQFLQGLSSPGSGSGPKPAASVLPSLLPPAPPLLLARLDALPSPFPTLLGKPVMIDTSTQTAVDMCTQTSPGIEKTAAVAAPSGSKRARVRAPAAPAASDRPGGGNIKLRAAVPEVPPPLDAPLTSPPPPGPRTARRRPVKPTAQGPAKKAATAPAGGDAPKKRPQKEQPDAPPAAKKAKANPAARPAATGAASHGSAAPLAPRFGPRLPPLPTASAAWPTKLRLTGAAAAAAGAAPSRGAKALTLARDAPAPAPKHSGAKVRPSAPGGRPALSKAPKAAAAPAAAVAAAAEAYAGVTCEVCGLGEPEESMLLCDGCDRGFHGDCLRPAVSAVPPGPWFCCPCRRTARAARIAARAPVPAAAPAPVAAPPAPTKSESTRCRPLPPGKLRRTRRSELQVLVFLGSRHAQAPLPERLVRAAHGGNNPDISKAVRSLLEAGTVQRFGDGTKSDPFTYKVADEAVGGLRGWQAALAADAALCGAESVEAQVQGAPAASTATTEGGGTSLGAGGGAGAAANGAAATVGSGAPAATQG